MSGQVVPSGKGQGTQAHLIANGVTKNQAKQEVLHTKTGEAHLALWHSQKTILSLFMSALLPIPGDGQNLELA